MKFTRYGVEPVPPSTVKSLSELELQHLQRRGRVVKVALGLLVLAIVLGLAAL